MENTEKKEKKRNLNTVEHSIKKERKTEHLFWKNRQCIDWTKEKPMICLNFVNFDCGHIVNIVWFVQNSWKISEKKRVVWV